MRIERIHHLWFAEWNLANVRARQAYEAHPDSTHRQPA